MSVIHVTTPMTYETIRTDFGTCTVKMAPSDGYMVLPIYSVGELLSYISLFLVNIIFFHIVRQYKCKYC